MKKMKNIGLYIMALLMFGITTSNAQIVSVSSEEYGRIFDLVYDVNTQHRMYAASLNNHILVSEDNGVNWNIFYSIPDGNVRELRMVNDTHLSFYLSNAINQDNNSIHLLELSSLNLTTINRPINNESSDRSVEDYSIYESNIDIMLYKEQYKVGFDNFNRVHYTTNGGQTWTLVYDEISNNLISVDKVLISYNNPNQLFITRGNGANGAKGGFLASINAGSSWTEYYAGINIRAVAVDPFNPNHWMIGTDPGYGEDEAVYETLNGGASWSELTISFDTHFEKAINEVIFHPTVAGNIYILETNEIAISTDGGATWSVQVYDPFTPSYYFGLSATFNPYNSNEVIFTSNWYPYRSTNGGISIQRMYSPFSSTTSVALSANTGVGQDPYLYYGVQGGLVSKNLITNIETSYGVQSIDLVSGSSAPLYIIDQGQYGRIFSSVEDFNGRALNVSTDHGQTFQTFYTGFWDPVLHMQPDPINTTEVWMSLDVFSGSGTNIIDITSPDPWNPTIIPITMPSSARHYSTWVNPNNNQEVLAGIGGELWSSTDRGTTWQNASNGLTMDPSAGGIYNIVQNPFDASEFVLASSDGIWKSTDNYASWTNILNATNVRTITYDPNIPQVLVAAVFESAVSNSGIYFSTDFGSSWTMIPVEELEYTKSASITFDIMDNGEGFKAYMASSDLGVITYDVMYNILGVDTPALNSLGMTIYPNPVTDIMNLAFENGSNPETIVIYDILGKEVKRFGKSFQLDLSDLNPGIYLVQVSNQNGVNVVKRILKK